MIQIDKNLQLDLISQKHVIPIYTLANQNKDYLRKWLPWLDFMDSEVFIQNFVNGAIQRIEEGSEFAFVILENEIVVGRIGIYKIDYLHKIGEIGYWIGQDFQGKGIVTKACKAIIDFGFDKLALNRIEIRCATENTHSKKIPQNLHFTHEGILRNGELLHGKFNDIHIYSLLKNDFK